MYFTWVLLISSHSCVIIRPQFKVIRITWFSAVSNLIYTYLSFSLRWDWSILGAQDQTSPLLPSHRWNRHSCTQDDDDEPSSAESSASSRSNLRAFTLFISVANQSCSFSQGTNYRSTSPLSKNSFTERSVNPREGFFKTPTSHRITKTPSGQSVATVSICQNQWTRYFVTSLSSLQQLSTAVPVYNLWTFPKHLWAKRQLSCHSLTNHTRDVNGGGSARIWVIIIILFFYSNWITIRKWWYHLKNG